ncbi:hypothetical protein CK203_090262 [Vitis vinifera]|uniref:Uncharacterized protein n=1 Tax=Vitis vinifera TaxID=29760 RepID=A0A438DT04_VITVI|nr:hypothetical protein CK203_090262 [Vitis vinifera]
MPSNYYIGETSSKHSNNDSEIDHSKAVRPKLIISACNNLEPRHINVFHECLGKIQRMGKINGGTKVGGAKHGLFGKCVSKCGNGVIALGCSFVCKSWYKASLDPKCWECLIFPKYIKPDRIWDNSPLGESQRRATVLTLPICCTEEALEYAANE